ncbi:MAG TPA: glycosyltransferase [Anaerolineaceae bacterium]|nr:glycosyltransferase [Anaerolineaceae bacterium]
MTTPDPTFKKITVIGPVYPYRGGIAHFTSALAETLQSQGHEVDIISYKWQYPKFLYPGKTDKDPSQSRTKPNASYILSSLNPFDWYKTFRYIRETKPDLVIFQWWVSIWSPAHAWLFKKLKRAGIPFKVLVHNTHPHEARAIDKILARYSLKHTRDFITMTDREAQKLKALLKTDINIQTVPHPIYKAFPSKGYSKTEARRHLGLAPDQPVLLFFGFVRAYKGLDLLLEAVAQLQAQDTPVQLLVGGEFWDDIGQYEAQIARLNIQDKVKIVAEYIPDEEASTFFEASDCLVAPYRDATQSGSVKLALGYGIPVVVSEVVADDFLRQMPSGCWIVPCDDSQALGEAIKNCLNAGEMSSESKHNIQETWQALTDALTN